MATQAIWSYLTRYRFYFFFGTLFLITTYNWIEKPKKFLTNHSQIVYKLISVENPADSRISNSDSGIFLNSDSAIFPNSDLVIFSEENPLQSDDPRAVEYLLKTHLQPPSSLEYNFKCSDASCNGKGCTVGPGSKYNLLKSNVLKLLKSKTNGFFIESGSNDGEFISNSIYLEKDYNWTGLLIEADPIPFAESKIVNRKAWLSNTCLSVTPNPKKIKMLQGSIKGWSALDDLKQNKMKKSNGSVIVECFPLYTYLLALNVTQVDFLSLDIEGAEYEVLSNFPFDKITIKVMTVETNKLKIPIPEFINFMKSKNFRLVTKIFGGCVDDHLFAHNSLTS